MEDQPLPADASPTALSSDYVVDSDPEKDEKDPKEDPAYCMPIEEIIRMMNHLMMTTMMMIFLLKFLYKRVVERRFHGSYEVGTMEIEANYSFSAAPAVAGCSSSTTTIKRSKRSTKTEVAVTVSGETLREAGDMLFKQLQILFPEVEL
nr:hypothetical protein [Tanacetum cinerariifolium]